MAGCAKHTWKSIIRGYTERLILSSKLYDHLTEKDQAYWNRMEQMIGLPAESEGVYEQLKESDQLGWVSRINSIYQHAKKIILEELAFV